MKKKSLDRTEKKLKKEKSPEAEIILHEVNFIKKPKKEIFLPSWRRMDVPRLKSVKRREELCEDLSDEAFIRRHEAAEAEEQLLWDKWRRMREEQGKGVTGRSTLGGWRMPDLEAGAPRLRSQRLSSARSEASSTPGRMSPASMDRVKEICVLSKTPTKVTLKTVLTSSDRQKRKSFDSRCQTQSDKLCADKSVQQSDISSNFDDSVKKRFRRSASSKCDLLTLKGNNVFKSGDLSSEMHTLGSPRILKESNVDRNTLSLQQRRYCNVL